MSVVTWERRSPTMLSIARKREKFRMRCAAHSARISVPGMPQTFSV